jgi:hypothetical protein
MEEKKKFKRKQPKSQPPLTADQVFRLENVMKHETPPKELQSLKSSNSFAFPAANDFKLENIVHKVDLGKGMRGWNISGGQKVIRGLPVREFVHLSQKELKVALPTLPLPPPSPPEWADLIYHPKMSPGIIRPTMRRINGKRVRPLFTFGNDDRQPFFPSGYPLQCVGKIFAWNDPYSFVPSWFGTGALVGPSTVLTASHVVPWDANPAMIQFIPAYFNGASTLGPNVYSFVDGAAATYQEPSPNVAYAAWDFAVLRLHDPLGDWLGWFGGKSYDDGWNDGNYWTLVGYPKAIAYGEQPSFQGGISFHDDDEDGDAMELETQNGDSSPGDSGGPMFAFWDDGIPYIVGVLSSEEEEPFLWPVSWEDNNIASAGAAMIDLVLWARSNWG